MERSRPRAGRRVQITARDQRTLDFVARHRLVLGDHVRSLLGVSGAAAQTRLRTLSAAGFLARKQLFHGQPACFQITKRGLELIGSDLPPPRLDLRCYQHDVGVAWLWLAARSGAFGDLDHIVAERQLRSHDGRSEAPERALGVRVGGVGPAGRERLHYPDLLLVAPGGRRIAVELELTPKGQARRELILSAYAADVRIHAVLYLVERRSLARAIETSARRLGIAELVHVQPVRVSAALRPADAAPDGERRRVAGQRGVAGPSAGSTAGRRTSERREAPVR